MADFLDQAFPEPEALEAEVAETPNPAPEPVAEAVPPEPVAPEVQTERPEEPKPGYVPLAAMMDERDKRKAAEERAARLEQAQQSAPQAIPDAYDDPEGYLAFQQQHLQQALQAQKMELSHHWAVEKYGKDGVEEARTWALEKAQNDPGFRAMLEAEMPMQAMPFDWIVQQHKRNGLYSQLPMDVNSLDELIEREIAKRGLTAPAAVAPIPVAATLQPAPKPVAPPRSIAGDSTPLAPTQTGSALSELDAIFSKR